MRAVPAQRAAGARGRDEIGDHLLALVLGLQSRKRHLVAGHHLLRIQQIGVECGDIPGEIAALHGGRIIVVRQLPAFLPTSPARLGPRQFLPGSSEWQAWHLRKTSLPVAMSPMTGAVVVVGAGTFEPTVQIVSAQCPQNPGKRREKWRRVQRQ